MENKTSDVPFDKLIAILQSEYQALKAEQTYRITIRENAFISNFLAIGVVASISFTSNPINISVLLLIPLMSSCICWVYLNNDIMVSKFRLYFTNEFPEKVIQTLNRDKENFSREEVLSVIASWEHFHRKHDKYRKLRKVLNTFFVFLGFIVVSISSLVVTAQLTFSTLKFDVVIWIFDAILIAIMLIALIITKDW